MNLKDFKIVISNRYQVDLYFKKDRVGGIFVVEDSDSSGPLFYIKESGIDYASARGFGLGTKMYLKLLREAKAQGIRLFKGKHSADADRVWQSLLERGYRLKKTGRESPYQKFEILYP